MDLENWMRKLPKKVRAMPVIKLAIPGSHNTMMYTVLKNSPAAPDAPWGLEMMHRLFPKCVQNWLLTQSYTIRQQLVHGIRYFDIRTSYHDAHFMFCHGLYSIDNLQPLDEINAFLETHPHEVVILDFQHVYNCDRSLHQKYCEIVLSIFGMKILSRQETDLTNCSIESMTASGKQVIVVYRHFCDEKPQFWCGNNFPTPWPNTMRRTRLKEILEENIQLRDMDNGYVTQCLLTPSFKYILTHPFGSVKESCAKRILQRINELIKGRVTGPNQLPTFNVFIADYVDLEEDKFTKSVISLNFPVKEQETQIDIEPEVIDLE